jgi:hypothetical protein
MLYHTAMIILHRPPRQLFKDPKTSTSKDIEICYESLDCIIKLLRIYSRHYQYSPLPLTFVHILASTASVILMKRYINNSTWEDVSISRPLEHVLEAIDGISQTWPAAKQVRGVITTAMERLNNDNTRNDSPESFDIMAGLADNGNFKPMNLEIGFEMDDANLGLFNPEEFFNDDLQWNGDFIQSNDWEATAPWPPVL